MDVIDAEIARASPDELVAYLQGALKDGCRSALHGTHRIGQSDPRWLALLKGVLARLGSRSWIYREGASREMWILETAASFLDVDFDPSGLHGAPANAYIRGYFDADGGLPRDPAARLYVQFVQKDAPDLERVRGRLVAAGVACGALHNPSVRVDPDYWRFFVAARSLEEFMRTVGSWHPRKRLLMEVRLGPIMS